MSQHAEDEPTVRVRRKTVLPARYDEYDLTGFALLKPAAQPMSPPTHSTRLAEGDDQEEGTTGFTPVLPAYEADSPLPWSDDEQESPSDDPPYRESQDPARRAQRSYRSLTPSPPPEQELMYRGPTPTIPDFIHPNPREFSRLKIALENILPVNATERFKFQILMDHLKLEEALLIADSYCHSQQPYTKTMAALDQQYGQPHQLALQRIAELMDGPSIASGDQKSFRLFALKVRSLVGMLEQLGRKGTFELQCGSHVSQLLGKLHHDLRSGFRRFAHPHRVPIPTLLDLAEWLEFEIEVQEDTSRFVSNQRRGPSTRTRETIRDSKPATKSTTIFLGTEKMMPESKLSAPPSRTSLRPYCPYCDNSKHSLNHCSNFKQLTKDQKRSWVKDNNRCWRCGRTHMSAECNLKMRCRQCSSRHLIALHDISAGKSESPKLVQDEPADTNTCLFSTMNAWRNEKTCVRSRQDQEAVEVLERKTIRVEVDGVRRYATPLLRVKNMPELKAPKEAVLSQLRATEKRLAKNPQQAAA
ncbi:hypothetical protein M9458_057313 [Cirrhinus mrigala]|uniref:Uncharacterized protein n=1 Tax=Cirrhinus mrigala TaxID=683832 RepID=A0ABD0MF55_CIRMR